MQGISLRVMMRRDDAFTLIELMMVVVILGILVGIAAPRITGVQERARRAVLEANANTVRNVMEMYYIFANHYPDLSSVGSTSELNVALGGDYSISDINIVSASGDGGDEFEIVVGEEDPGDRITIDQAGVEKSW